MDFSKQSTEDIIKSILGFIVSVICVIVILFIGWFKNLRKKKANQLLLNLCIGHLLTGTAHFCRILSFPSATKFVFSGYMYSTIALVLLSFDRFIFIRHPFRYYTRRYNRAHTVFMLFSPLVYCIYFVDSFISVIMNDKAKLAGSFIFVFFTTITVLIFLNVSIYATICKQRRAIETQCKRLSILPTLIAASSTGSVSPSTESTTSTNNSTPTNSRLPSTTSTRSFSIDSTSSTTNLDPQSISDSAARKYKKARARKQEVRSFYLCFGCVITFALLMSPWVTTRIMLKFTLFHISKKIQALSMVFAAFNSLSDLLIFVWFNVELRVVIKKTIWKRIQPQT